MNVIFFSRRGRARHLNLEHPVTLAVLTFVGIGLLASTFVLGLSVGHRGFSRAGLLDPALALQAEQAQIADVRAQVQDKVSALAMQLGVINAHVVRLNSLGKRLTQMANINSREFDFDHDPPRGGPDSAGDGHSVQVADLTSLIDTISRRVDARSAQYSALETVMLGQQLSEEIMPTGRPVREGYISSGFGERMDPFDGEQAFHKGVDFAAQSGSDVLAVAPGIVTYSGPREGYGNVVEITHGNGLSTRYGHASRTLVTVGEQVERGQAVALVGSTGRSTGPHVHFEVLKDGRQIDPMTFIEH